MSLVEEVWGKNWAEGKGWFQWQSSCR